MVFPKRVEIREVGPREGLQTIAATVDTGAKLELVKALAATGVKRIEVTSFVRPDRVPQMADAQALAERLEGVPDVAYEGLYLNPRGFEQAIACPRLDTRGWIYSATSDEFLSNNSNTTRARVLDGLAAWVELFRRHRKTVHGVMISTVFGSNTEGRTADATIVTTVTDLLGRLGDLGETPREVSLADTMGWGNPEQVRRIIDLLRARLPAGAKLSMHLHDTRGTGIANAYAALSAGIDAFDASVGGMGGCPFAKGASGNIATEDLAYLCAELGCETGLDLEAYVNAAETAARITGVPIASKLPRAWKYRPAS